ncbi:hypothetical protein [Rhizobium mongolense]
MKMINRRQALGALASAVVVAPVAARIVHTTEADPADRVRIDAEALADSLKALHGGSWSIQISHETGFVAVSKDFA